jgi:hypothetical protein
MQRLEQVCVKFVLFGFPLSRRAFPSFAAQIPEEIFDAFAAVLLLSPILMMFGACGRTERDAEEISERSVDCITIRGREYSTSLTGLSPIGEPYLTDADIEPLKYMTNPENLDLQWNTISDIGPFASFVRC